MKIIVKIFGPRYFGISQYDTVSHIFEVGDGASVRDVLKLLEKLHPGINDRLLKGEKTIPMHDIWINDRSIDFLNGLDTKGGCGPDNSALWRLETLQVEYIL